MQRDAPTLRVEPAPVDVDALVAEYVGNQQSIIDAFLENGMDPDNKNDMKWFEAALSGEETPHPKFAATGAPRRAMPRQTVHMLPRALRKKHC